MAHMAAGHISFMDFEQNTIYIVYLSSLPWCQSFQLGVQSDNL